LGVGGVTVERLVVVDRRRALALVALLAPGRRQVRVDAMALPPHVRALLADLDELAAGGRAELSGRAELTSLPVATAAKRLGISPQAVRALAMRGTLPGYQVDGRWFLLEAAVTERAERNAAQPRATSAGGDLSG
jgi:ribosomal protein S14